MEGQRFGKLVVLGMSKERDYARRQFVVVRCDCGMVKDVRKHALMRRGLVSCGQPACKVYWKKPSTWPPGMTPADCAKPRYRQKSLPEPEFYF